MIAQTSVATPCHECGGRCCTAGFGFKYLWLEYEEIRLFPSGLERFNEHMEEPRYVYSLTNGCIHLKDGKCSIYEKRPKACKEYSCTSHYVHSPNTMLKYMNNETKTFMINLITKALEYA